MEDYGGLCAVLAECDTLHSTKLPDRFCPPPAGQAARTREYIASLLDDPDTSVLVAEQRGQVMGAIITIVRNTAPLPILTPRRVANIEIISVRHDQQGHGIGQALMKQAEQWATSKGAGDIELSVYLFNQKAIRFYSELGFQSLYQKMVKKI